MRTLKKMPNYIDQVILRFLNEGEDAILSEHPKVLATVYLVLNHHHPCTKLIQKVKEYMTTFTNSLQIYNICRSGSELYLLSIEKIMETLIEVKHAKKIYHSNKNWPEKISEKTGDILNYSLKTFDKVISIYNKRGNFNISSRLIGVLDHLARNFNEAKQVRELSKESSHQRHDYFRMIELTKTYDDAKYVHEQGDTTLQERDLSLKKMCLFAKKFDEMLHTYEKIKSRDDFKKHATMLKKDLLKTMSIFQHAKKLSDCDIYPKLSLSKMIATMNTTREVYETISSLTSYFSVINQKDKDMLVNRAIKRIDILFYTFSKFADIFNKGIYGIKNAKIHKYFKNKMSSLATSFQEAQSVYEMMPPYEHNYPENNENTIIRCMLDIMVKQMRDASEAYSTCRGWYYVYTNDSHRKSIMQKVSCLPKIKKEMINNLITTESKDKQLLDYEILRDLLA